MQPQSLSSPIGRFTVALRMLAAGTLGPYLLILLAFLFANLVGGASNIDWAHMMSQGPSLRVSVPATGVAVAGMAAFSILTLVLSMVGLAGLILCMFTPLSQNTKIKLGLTLVCLLLSGVSWISVPIGLVAYFFFLCGMCRDLKAPELTAGFRSSAKFGMLSLISLGAGTWAVSLLGALGLVRYGQALASLARRANELRLQA